jgi:DNA-directed RNA polymerase subunit H
MRSRATPAEGKEETKDAEASPPARKRLAPVHPARPAPPWRPRLVHVQGVVTVPKAFDVMKHDLVPRHEVLSDDEARAILDKYGATPDQFPKIFASDAVARAIRAKPGQIVRIRRKSPTAGEAIAYRYVVE